MKKLIYLLLLISGGISAQIVQPRSTTTFSNVRATGSMTVANKLRVGSTVAPSATLDVTGTMSVSGTSTLTGAAKQTNTLNYEGNTTWNTNQTNTLTTGNTGTVAVLSDAYFTNSFCGGQTNPADGSTYYVGTSCYPMGSNRIGGFYVPANCELVQVNGVSIVTTSTATAETYTLQAYVNGSTATNLTTSLTNTAVITTFSTTASLSLNAGDYVEARIITPAWVTNPVGINFQVTFVYRRRQ